MSEPTTTGGGSAPNMDADAAPTPPPEIAGAAERSALVATNRTTATEYLEAARLQLDAAERYCAVLRGRDVRYRELNDAVSRIQEAHGLLWQLSRRLAGHQELNEQAPLKMSIDYVAWVLGNRRIDHWTAELLRLLAKADPGHRARLAEAFPLEAAALEAWMNTPFGDVAEPPVGP